MSNLDEGNVNDAFLQKYLDGENSKYVSQIIQIESDKQLSNLICENKDSSVKKVKKEKDQVNFKYNSIPKGGKKIKSRKEIIEKIEDVSVLDSNNLKVTMSNLKQPNYNIGVTGMVSEGKSTLTYAVTGQATQRSRVEMERNITMKVGYADSEIWNIGGKYVSRGFNKELIDSECNDSDKRCHVSFVDCPGHFSLIKNMLSSVGMMHAVIVVVSVEGNNLLNKTSLIQHLRTIKLSGIKDIIVCLNKIDLIKDDRGTIMKKYEELKGLLENMEIEISYPIIPTVFQLNIGTDILLDAICYLYSKREHQGDNYFLSNRSFDINKPGTNYKKMLGACVGGSLIGGELHVGDEIEIKPGLIVNNNYVPIRTTITSLKYNRYDLDRIVPGGLISIGTNLVPSIAAKNPKNDRDGLAGKLLGKVGELPPVYKTLVLCDIKTNIFDYDWTPVVNEKERITVQFENQMRLSVLQDISEERGEYTFELKSGPMCIGVGKRVVLMKISDSSLNILGYGTLVRGEDMLEEGKV